MYYTTIADGLRMVSLSNDSYTTGAGKVVFEIPTFPLTTKAMQSKGHNITICNYSSLYKPKTNCQPNGRDHKNYNTNMRSDKTVIKNIYRHPEE